MTRAALVVAIVVAIVVAVGGVGHAYPQFQLSKDQTCSDCHLSPAGGGLLGENGLAVAQATSLLGEDPGPLYGAATLPTWFALGGDVRAATGYDAIGGDSPNHGFVLFPMQAEVSAAATVQHFSLHVTAGLEDPQYDHTARTLFASREHWLQWQQDAGVSDGLFVRVGRFMPVFGLRFAEHPDYDRRYGGTPLYGEAYGAAVEYIDPRWEVHATGFVHDPLQDTTELGDGATFYGEVRLAPTTAVGLEGKYDVTPDDRKLYGGVTAKQYFASAGLLVQGEGEIIHQNIDGGGYDDQLVAYLVGSYFLPRGFLIDLGLGAYDPDVRVRNLGQEVADLNVHWFATSHVELLLTTRFQMLVFGEGGQGSGYTLLQIHYRI